jgi:hypothetical protein
MLLWLWLLSSTQHAAQPVAGVGHEVGMRHAVRRAVCARGAGEVRD